MKRRSEPVLWWMGEVLLAALFQCVPYLSLLLSPDGAQGGVLLYALCLYVLQPAAALLLPAFLTYQRGVNALAAFFPIGLFLLVFPAYAQGVPLGIACLLLGLLSAAFGAEKRKRSLKKR